MRSFALFLCAHLADRRTCDSNQRIPLDIAFSSDLLQLRLHSSFMLDRVFAPDAGDQRVVQFASSRERTSSVKADRNSRKIEAPEGEVVNREQQYAEDEGAGDAVGQAQTTQRDIHHHT